MRSVCSYNYDDLYEIAVQSTGRVATPVCAGAALGHQTADTMVYHPHGFLPSGNWTHVVATEDIVLSEDDYHALYAEPYARPETVPEAWR
jgi:SIR2-like domain